MELIYICFVSFINLNQCCLTAGHVKPSNDLQEILVYLLTDIVQLNGKVTNLELYSNFSYENTDFTLAAIEPH